MAKSSKKPGPADARKQAAELFQSGESKLNVDDYDGAIQDFRNAVELDAQEQEYISTYGSVLAEVGRTDEAVQTLQAAVQRFPEEGFEKYMYLGQLLNGETGVQCLEKGIAILQAKVDQVADPLEKKELQIQLASGLCSVVELKMAAMGDSEVDQVAAVCEPLLMQASQADSASPEPKQVLASLRYEQGKPEEALQSLKDSMALWYRRGDEAASEHSHDQELNGDAMHRDELPCPSFEFRFETAKLLVELDETTEDAVRILESLLEENDQDIHVVYLLGLAYHAGGDPETAMEVVLRGEALLAVNQQFQSKEIVMAGFARLKGDIEETAKLSKDMQSI